MSGGILKVDVELATNPTDWGDPQADQLIFIVNESKQEGEDFNQQKLSALKSAHGERVQETEISFDGTKTASFETFLPAQQDWHLTVFLRQSDGDKRTYFEIPHNFDAFRAKQIDKQTWTLEGVKSDQAKVTAQFSSLDEFVELGDAQECVFGNAKYIKVQTGVFQKYDGNNGNMYGRTYGAGRHLNYPEECVQFIDESNSTKSSSDIKAIEWHRNEKTCKVYFSQDGMTKDKVREIEIQRDDKPPTTSNCYMRKTVRDEIMGDNAGVQTAVVPGSGGGSWWGGQNNWFNDEFDWK